MPPASSSITFEKIVFRMMLRAFAAVLYSISPLTSCARNVNTDARNAAPTALFTVLNTTCGSNKLPRNCETISASAVVPTSVKKLTAAIARIHCHSPLASLSKVLFNKSMVSPPSDLYINMLDIRPQLNLLAFLSDFLTCTLSIIILSVLLTDN